MAYVFFTISAVAILILVACIFESMTDNCSSDVICALAALLMLILGLITGSIMTQNIWEQQLLRQEKVEYIVDSETGKTELVWSKDKK